MQPVTGIEVKWSQKMRSDQFPLVPPAPWSNEVEQEQITSGNGDREAVVLGADLSNGEGERAYTVYDPNLGGKSS